MDHFSIIKTLCRIGLGSENPAFRYQVERLRQALIEGGNEKEGKALDKLLEAPANEQSLTPSRIVASNAHVALEQLTPKTLAPSDRETGASLAEIVFPDRTKIQAPILPPNLKDAVDTLLIEWHNWESLAKMGVSPPRSCMIFGLPGTGKTHLARYIATMLGLPLVVARLDGLVSSFLGTTARNLGSLFNFCNRYSCVLLLDEFDAIAKVRDDPQEVGEIKRVVNTLLQNIDQRAAIGFTVAITNHEGLLDTAVWRRFEVRLSLPLPDQAGRESIVRRYLPPLVLNDEEIRFLAWLSEGMSGSDVRNMMNAFKRQAGLANGTRVTVFDSARVFATTHAGTNHYKRLALLAEGAQPLVRAAMADNALRMTQDAIATIVGKDQTTVSRWLKSL